MWRQRLRATIRHLPISITGVAASGAPRITCSTHAIDRYGFDQAALEFAQKSYALFMNDWKINQHDDELYHAWGGSGGGDLHYTWGALLLPSRGRAIYGRESVGWACDLER